MKSIADRIAFLRGTKSRRAFAIELGIQESTLRNYESGASQPNFDTLQSICKILRTNPAWLLLGDEMESTEKRSEQHIVTLKTAEPCQRCAKLETKLERVEEKLERVEGQRDKLADENQQLLRENGELKEKNATLRERQRKEQPSLLDENHQTGGFNEIAQVRLSR